MSLASISRVDRLRKRASMLALSRQFFAEKKVKEVDVPALSSYASVDAHIDLLEVDVGGKKRFLHSSPEYGMKRLLAEGMGDIYQISHVFRKGECGARHHPEFSLVEWYRLGFTLHEMIEETLAYLNLFTGMPASFTTLSYKEALSRYSGHYPELQEKRDELFALEVEPHLKAHVIVDFPKEQAALARLVDKKGERVAERFEVYYQGFELANGYHELLDPFEQKERLEAQNKERLALGKESLPIDPHFLGALEKGVPPCCGVACGFDRLMMLHLGASHIEEVLPFFGEQT